MLTCVALSTVKEEPHLLQGQVSSEDPLGYSIGRHRPASSARNNQGLPHHAYQEQLLLDAAPGAL